jgi:stearoyl-CoA desaturase (Delta-9 desaturase)
VTAASSARHSSGPSHPGAAPTPAARAMSLPEIDPEPNTVTDRLVISLFIIVPLLAVLAAAPVAWRFGLSWADVVIALAFYLVSGLGISMGFHRHFTHSSFKAARPLRLALGIAGSLALEGPLLTWVADHRRHHKYSDRAGDPHSPWRFGTSPRAVAKGFLWAHVGWMLDRSRTSQRKFCPDLRADPTASWVSATFPAWAAVSLLAPAVIGGLWTMSPAGALAAFFWAGLVRVAVLHHVTWSVNSVCHLFGRRDFQSRDKSTNNAWLAIPSFGESWHNLHHADPTCARHGVLLGQIDICARVTRWAERLGLAWDVRWPDEQRLRHKLTSASKGRRFGGMTSGQLTRSPVRAGPTGQPSDPCPIAQQGRQS